MLARLPLRSKLVLVVSVPLFLILGFAGFGIAGRLDALEGQRQYGRLRAPNDALTGLQGALEREGVLTTWSVATPAPDPAVQRLLDRARRATDRAVEKMAAAGLHPDDVSRATRRAWVTLQTRLVGLAALRRQADDRAGLPAAFGERYRGLDGDVLGVAGLLARDVEDRELADAERAVVDLRRAQAATARGAMVALPYLVTGTTTQLDEWAAAAATNEVAVDEFLASASHGARAAFEQVLEAAPADELRAVAGEDLTALLKAAITPARYFDLWSERHALTEQATAAVQRTVDATAADLESNALRDVLAYGLGVSALVLSVLVLAWIMIRSVNRSLQRLTEAARDVAEVRLPQLVDTLRQGGDPAAAEPIRPLEALSKDEIGALAQAFNTIQETTVQVAEEQAALVRKGIGDLYVNLARRNQSLVDRQIALLDALEARAEDPDQLASLFELDHLATRMRRNAESLLVLSGAGQARQWSDAIPILDVVRAASGEIADFARVNCVGFESEVAVAGHAVADVTHLVAELLENATTFSPPGTPVVVAGMLAERRFVVSITDEGIGMSDQQLAAANALLQEPPPPGLSLSRTLGLHVVAHLARRYGIRVQLRRAATNGVTAIVALPASILTRAQPGARPGRAEPPVTPVASPAAASSSAPARAPEPAVVVVEHGPASTEPPRPSASREPPPPAGGPGGDEPGAGPPGQAVFDAGGLPRRVPGASPLGADPRRPALPSRSPGRHLSHPPGSGSIPAAEGDARPRPERVHDLLTRHLRGIRDGRRPDPDAAVSARGADPEDHR